MSIHLKERLKNYFGVIIIILWGLGFSLQIKRILSYEDSLSGALMVATFFTNHANLFICISTLLLLIKKHNKHIDRFHFVAAFDITITGVVFFALLLPFMPEVTFLQVLLHGIIPPLYLCYYLISFNTKINTKLAWIVLIHPFVYFIFVFTIAHPLYGDYLYNLFPLEVDPYIYPFLNPIYFWEGTLGMLLVNILILFPISLLLGFVILQLKKRIDERKKRTI